MTASSQGEIAATVFEPRLCSHVIYADERSCECGMRIAVVVKPLQLALFAWPRERRRNLHYSRPGIAEDGITAT